MLIFHIQAFGHDEFRRLAEMDSGVWPRWIQ